MTAVPLFSMIDGLAPVTNVLAVSDPNVHRIDSRWTMFLGGFTTRLRVELFSATLPVGAPLGSDDRVLTTQPGAPRRALSLVPPPPQGEWDRYGMHTPCYVEGRNPDDRRIYYAGRRSRRTPMSPTATPSTSSSPVRTHGSAGSRARSAA